MRTRVCPAVHLCTRFCMCAGCCASMGMGDGHGTHARHTGEGCTCVPRNTYRRRHVGAGPVGARTSILWGARASVWSLYVFFQSLHAQSVGGCGSAWPATSFPPVLRVSPCLFPCVRLSACMLLQGLALGICRLEHDPAFAWGQSRVGTRNGCGRALLGPVVTMLVCCKGCELQQPCPGPVQAPLPASVCRGREDGAGTDLGARHFFLHQQGCLGPIGA